MSLRGLLLFVFFIASLPVCFIRPFYGIILWIVVAFLNPQAYVWDSYDALPWAAAVAVPTLLGILCFERRFERLFSRDVLLLGVLWVWFTLTTVITTQMPEFLHHAPETWERWKFVSKIMLMTVCLLPVVHDFSRLRVLVLTIAGCFGFYVVKSLPFIILTGGEHRLFGPERSMIADNTDFGMALVMTLPFYFSLAQTETKRWAKWLNAFLFLITIPAIFFTYSRGALVALAAVFLILMLQSRRRLTLIPVAALGLAVALMFAPAQWQERMNPTREDAVDASAQSRLLAWGYARALAADYPITGGGFSTFTAELYERYWPGQIGAIYGPHSVYFQVLAEHGYVGLALYITLILSCFATAQGVKRAAKGRHDQVLAHYASMFQISLVGFLVSGIFLGRAYFDYFFTIVALISVLGHVHRQRAGGAIPATAPISHAPVVGAETLPPPVAGTAPRKPISPDFRPTA